MDPNKDDGHRDFPRFYRSETPYRRPIYEPRYEPRYEYPPDPNEMRIYSLRCELDTLRQSFEAVTEQLKMVTANQTHLLNTNSRMQERIDMLNERLNRRAKRVDRAKKPSPTEIEITGKPFLGPFETSNRDMNGIIIMEDKDPSPQMMNNPLSPLNILNSLTNSSSGSEPKFPLKSFFDKLKQNTDKKKKTPPADPVASEESDDDDDDEEEPVEIEEIDVEVNDVSDLIKIGQAVETLKNPSNRKTLKELLNDEQLTVVEEVEETAIVPRITRVEKPVEETTVEKTDKPTGDEEENDDENDDDSSDGGEGVEEGDEEDDEVEEVEETVAEIGDDDEDGDDEDTESESEDGENDPPPTIEIVFETTPIAIEPKATASTASKTTGSRPSKKSPKSSRYYRLHGKNYPIDLDKLERLKKPLKKLESMVGMEKVKESIVDQILYYIQNFDRKNRQMLHTVIEGPPGVGKTELGKIMAEIFSTLGVIESNKIKFIKRTDLVGEYLGHTAHRTKEAIEEAEGGVLFIDEAYSLGNAEKKDSFAKEAIDTLTDYLSSYKGKMICIIAGYPDDLEKCFFSYNRGLRRRFPFTHTIEKYTDEQLAEIFTRMVTKMKWKLDEESMPPAKVTEMFKDHVDDFPHFGGDIENLLTHAKYCHSRRVFMKRLDRKKLLTCDDISQGLERFVKHKKKDTAAAEKKEADERWAYIKDTMFS